NAAPDSGSGWVLQPLPALLSPTSAGPTPEYPFMWTRDSLQLLITSKLPDIPFVVVANREPFQHRLSSAGITCVPAVSGLAAALDPILRACHGTWIAHGSGNADRDTVDAHDRLMVPPDDPSYTLRRVWLTPEQEAGYYDGLANEGLWPL